MSRLPISERRNQITALLLEQGSIGVRALADRFQVTTETVRKDLLALEEKNILSKGHGDATLSSTYQENPFARKMCTHIERKSRIAKRALELIPEGGVVMVDAGTTSMQLAKLLNLRSDLVVVTNSLSAAQALSETENQLLVVGGELRTKSQSLVGSWAAASLDGVQADVAFLGCDGFHWDGPSTRSYRELEIKQTMVRNARKSVLLCDSSKLDTKGLYRITGFDRFFCLITDSGATPGQQTRLSEQVELILA